LQNDLARIDPQSYANFLVSSAPVGVKHVERSTAGTQCVIFDRKRSSEDGKYAISFDPHHRPTIVSNRDLHRS
jgi:hypothetical protein